MRQVSIRTIFGNYRIEIEQDTDLRNPRLEFDGHLCTFAYWHRRYILGEENGAEKFGSMEDFTIWAKENEVMYMPVRLYDHSGLTVSLMNQYPYNDQWDSMCCGFIYVPVADVIKEFGDFDFERAVECMKSEIAELDDYLTGNVYGFKVCNEMDEELDSCWGFYGDPEKGHLMDEARLAIEYDVSERVRTHLQNLKNWIRNRVPVFYRKPLIAEA